MISVFFRLWLLVFLPLFFLVFSSTYNPINAINNGVLFDRVTETFKGTFFLLEKHLESIPQQQWDADFPSITNQFAYEVTLISAETQIDYGGSIEDLAFGDFIIYSDSNDSDIIIKRVPNSDRFIHMRLEASENQETLNQSRGTVYLIVEQLTKVEPAEWSKRLKELQPNFGFDLILIDRPLLDIPPNKLTQLDKTGATWLTSEEDETEIYQKMPESSLILKAGAIPLPGAELSVLVAVISVFILGISLGIFVFVFPLWRDLSKLTQTASQFGSGYLAKRAPIGRFSVITKLASSFNSMADRIEKMVIGQRELTNAIAHDLRTPLSRLSFAFEMLESDNTISEEEKRRYERSIASGIDTLDHLIQQILALSRYSRVADITHFGEYPLAQLIRNEISLVQTEYSDILFEWGAEPGLTDKPFFIDQRAMLRALNNLISNALRYTNKTIRVHLYQDANDYVLSVEDDGKGVPEADREKVFLPFKQLDNEQREVSKEHGLGLAIVQQIAEWHKGSTVLKTSTLGGALFEIRWPIPQEK